MSYSADIRPIFERSCNWCHHAGSGIRADLTDPFGDEGMVGRANGWGGASQTVLIDPGNPDNSFILRKVSATDLDPDNEGVAMPLPVPAVSADEIDELAVWIDTGASTGAPFNEALEVFGSDTAALGNGTAEAGTGKCVWCHYPGSPTILDVTDPADPTFGLVNVNARVGGVRVIPGDSAQSILIRKLEGTAPLAPMPFNPPRLSADEIDLLTRWIEAGALDN